MDFGQAVESSHIAGLPAGRERRGNLPCGGVRLPAAAGLPRQGRPGVCHPQLFDCQFDGGGWPSGDPDAPDQCPRHGSGATGELQRFMPPALPYRTAPGRGPGHGGPPPCLLPPPPPRHGAAGLRYRPRFLLSPVRRRVLGQLERLLLRSGGGHLPALRRQMAGQQQLSADADMQRHRLPAVSSAGAGGPGE